MKKYFLILIIGICTFCTNKKAQDPKDLYSMEQVAVFLKDLYMLEQKIKELRLEKDSARVVFSYYEEQLYEKHEMTDSLYRESFTYYMDDIKGLSRIYEIIADSLSLEERLSKVKKEDERLKKKEQEEEE